MSAGNYLDRLLDGVAVEWVEVGKLVTSQRGRRLVKSQLEEIGSYAVYQNSMKPLGYYHESNAQAGTAFVIVAGAAGEIGFSDVAFWAADDVYFFPESNVVDSKYLYHFLLTKQHEISSQVRRASIPRLSIAAVEKLEIPIPCPDNPKKSLEIQAEIVRILDAFTAVTSELTTRKKQYNHYRDKLLSFEDGGVSRLPLGHPEVGDFIRGGGLQKKDFTENGVGCIHYGQIYTHYGTHAERTKTYVSEECFKKARKAKHGDLIIATTSENDEDVCKAVAWLGKEEIAVSSDACIFRHTLNPKFVSYFFQTEEFQKQKRQYITGAKVRRVNADDLAKFLIPIPSLNEQARIVAILDKFDALTHSLTEGLPREIELRQKQYAHYRDLLLSFPKPYERAA